MDWVLFTVGAGMVLFCLAQFMFWTAHQLRRHAAERSYWQLQQRLLVAKIAATERLERPTVSPPAGVPDPASALGDLPAWLGWRTLRVEKLVRETATATSVYLVSPDGQPLPEFLPGQFLTLRFKLPEQTSLAIRCYSLSAAPNPDFYRITVKNVHRRPVSPGGVSRFIHDQLAVGDLIESQAPAGDFCWRREETEPAVFLAGGVGITPMMSMIEDSLQRDEGRELVLFYGARCSAEHLFQDRLAELSRQHANFQVVTCYSRPAPEDVLGLDYHVLGRVSLDLIQKTLPSPKVRFYVCGPGAFTGQLHQQLQQWGAAAEAIRFEAFGPASVHSDKSCWSERPVEQTDAGRVAVRFARSQRTGEWTTVQGNLLETGLSMGIPMSFGCRAGQCGECQIRLLQGQVHYPNGRPANLEDGYCLPCIAAPLPRATTADIDQVVLDA